MYCFVFLFVLNWVSTCVKCDSWFAAIHTQVQERPTTVSHGHRIVNYNVRVSPENFSRIVHQTSSVSAKNDCYRKQTRRAYMHPCIPSHPIPSDPIYFQHHFLSGGRRGNIVQVYPSVEYDFVPSELSVEQGTLLHFQWTGSDANPNGNAGGDPSGARFWSQQKPTVRFGDWLNTMIWSYVKGCPEKTDAFYRYEYMYIFSCSRFRVLIDIFRLCLFQWSICLRSTFFWGHTISWSGTCRCTVDFAWFLE